VREATIAARAAQDVGHVRLIGQLRVHLRPARNETRYAGTAASRRCHAMYGRHTAALTIR
jgi:hypothetical protein